MENNWKGIKEELTSTCQEVLDRKRHQHKRWISIERKNKGTAINSSRTRTEEVKAQAEYTEANKQVKKSTRADKQEYEEDLATTAEKAARKENKKQLYDTTKKLARRYSKTKKPVNDKGKTITEIEEQRNGWVEYIEGLLNKSPQ
ncbi:unnamed protein product [Schistosoma margrebowiei]|uniref:Uncharacterized protein n=1 Tax=Schistosoma margrebowiei TaxID=48269 RepID=A0A183LMG7_9TREM|nr:unnamed protein product [Schistosoma margrebowiei]